MFFGKHTRTAGQFSSYSISDHMGLMNRTRSLLSQQAREVITSPTKWSALDAIKILCIQSKENEYSSIDIIQVNYNKNSQ